MKVHEVEGLEDLKQLAERLVSSFVPRQVLLLRGPLGVGKTQLVRYLLNVLGGDEAASSPTFAIHNSYNTPGSSLEHFDLYRIESDEDLESTGFWEVFDRTGAIIAIEWPERISSEDIPKSWSVMNLQLEFNPQAPGTSARRISIG